MINILNLFPVPLGITEFKNHHKFEKHLIEYCLNLKKNIKKGGSDWVTNVFNTSETYNILEDNNFEQINTWVLENILQFSKNIGYNQPLKDKNSFFNVYNKYDYQELHDHEGADVSAVYYLNIPKNSGKTFFVSHEAKGTKDVFIKDNPYTWKKYFIDPNPGQLIMFKSNLLHGVTQSQSTESKISFAYNFKF